VNFSIVYTKQVTCITIALQKKLLDVSYSSLLLPLMPLMPLMPLPPLMPLMPLSTEASAAFCSVFTGW
jgi:hypothetical protein